MPDLADYKGRWIATGEDGSVAAVGETLDEARRFGVQARPRSRLTLAWVSPHPPYIRLPEWPLTTVQAIRSDAQVWLAGGPVRDLLLDRSPHDWDFVTDGSGLKLARAVANALGGGYYPLDAERGTGRAIVEAPGSSEPITLDFAQLRGPGIEEDLWKRDFTLNAMALTLDGRLIDPAGGRFDLEDGVLRMTKPSAFEDDPARLVRAVRLATQFSFTIEPETVANLRSQLGRIQDVAPERIRQELVKLLAHPRAHLGLQQLADLDLLGFVLPDLKEAASASTDYQKDASALIRTLHDIDQLLHGEPGLMHARRSEHPHGDAPPPWAWQSLSDAFAQQQRGLLAYLAGHVSAEVTRADLLKWAALFCPLAGVEGTAPAWQLAESQLEALRFAGDSIHFTAAAVRCLPQFNGLAAGAEGPAGAGGARIADREIYRYFRATGDAGVGVALLALAWQLARHGSRLNRGHWVRQLTATGAVVEAYIDRRASVIAPPPLLTGVDLMRLGLPQGPLIGQALDLLREAQAAGEIADRAGAVAFIKPHIESHVTMWNTSDKAKSVPYDAS